LLSKSCIAAAALTVACGAASAQSSVSVYGRLDVRMFKNLNSTAKELGNGSGSRLGFRGVEELGDGMSAFFDLQHRLNADTGAQTTTNFYQQSFVGLEKKGVGRVWFGRDYTPGYIQVMLISDPFDHANVGSMITVNTGGIAVNRISNAVTASTQIGGFRGTVQVGASEGVTRDRQYSTAFLYTGGPLTVGWGYENPGTVASYWSQLVGVYSQGPYIARLGLGKGKTSSKQDREAWSAGLTYVLGANRFHLAYGQLDNESAGTALNKKLGVGWQYFLSKRTNLYVNYGQDSVLKANKSGYDLGIKHNF
jgi:general bacterial porin, GBP family